MRSQWRSYMISAGLLAAAVLWIWLFRGFVSTELALVEDAVAYYEHTKFYLDHIRQGIFPLWNPTYEYGSPNAFFLCRIGPYNPLINLPLILSTVISPFLRAHVLGLILYYFIGLAGFFLVARRYHRDDTAAYISTLILLFSALGTRLFDSFILIMFVPMMWFFYFAWAFIESPRADRFWGLVLALFIITGTYIPFYFVLVAAACGLSWLVFYRMTGFKLLRPAVGYCRQRLFQTGLAVILLTAVVLPAFLFFSGGNETVVMPMRHHGADVEHMTGVHEDVVTKWAILEDLFFSGYFLEDMRRMGFAVFYVPVFLFLLFFIGIVTPVTRRQGCLLFWGLVLLILGMPRVTGVYNFLYEHVKFFQYFRNLHFFLWIILLPVFVLYVVEQLRIILSWKLSGKRRAAFLIFILLVHLGAVWFLIRQGTALPVSLATVIMSAVFWAASVLNPQWRRFGGLPIVLLVMIVAEPVTVFGYLTRNSERLAAPYRYDYAGYMDFEYVDSSTLRINLYPGQLILGPADTPQLMYYGTQGYDFLRQNINDYIRDSYSRFRIIAYEQAVVFDEMKDDPKTVALALRDFPNTAFVPPGTPIPTDFAGPPSAPRAEVIRESSPRLEVTRYNANGMVFRTGFERPRLVVINNNYDPRWVCRIDGKSCDIIRANIAFKGIFVPAGEHVIKLRYGPLREYVLHYGLVLAGIALLVAAAGLSWHYRSGGGRVS